MRVGIGYDVHPLVSGRSLILGGVTIPFDRGLEGHSDADALVHAIADALLGAAALGDLGRHFPDTDPAFRNVSSLRLLEMVSERVRSNGYEVGNVDAVVIAEVPKLAPYLPAMCGLIAKTLGVKDAAVCVKATTHERLGSLGREEGIAAQAVCVLYRAGATT